MNNKMRMPILQKEVYCPPSPSVAGEAYQMKLNADVALFLAKGGVVTSIPNGSTAEKFKHRSKADILSEQKRRFNINGGDL
jgi:hypothetical protein